MLSFWFGHHPDDAVVASERRDLWFGKDAALDREVKEAWAALLPRAETGHFDPWIARPRGRLALLILLDQGSRVLYRGDARSFANDRRALSLCREGLDASVDRALRPIERVFFYLPLEHSESLHDQERCVALGRALAEEVPAAWRETFLGFADYAERHREVIARFGRFPHRNEILGRESTPDEAVFLENPQNRF